MVRLKALRRARELFSRELDAWVAGSIVTGAVLLAIFGFCADTEGEPIHMVYLFLVWLVLPLGATLLFAIVHFGAPGDNDPE